MNALWLLLRRKVRNYLNIRLTAVLKTDIRDSKRALKEKQKTFSIWKLLTQEKRIHTTRTGMISLRISTIADCYFCSPVQSKFIKYRISGFFLITKCQQKINTEKDDPVRKYEKKSNKNWKLENT